MNSGMNLGPNAGIRAADLKGAVISDAGSLHALEAPWWALWRETPAATPFQSPAWLLPWWEAFAPGELATLAVWAGERLVALAPLYLETGPLGRRLLPLGIGISDYLDVLVEPGWAGAAGAMVMDLGGALGWDVWEWEEMRPEATGWQVGLAPFLEATTADQSVCPVLTIAGGAGWLPPASRAQHERALARARKKGEVAIEPVASDTPRFLDELARLHRARWQEKGEDGVLEDQSVRRFHERALPALMAAGLARCSLLRIGGEIVAAYYGLGDRGRAYYYLSGFDPAVAAVSPGTLVVGDAIMRAAGEGAGEFHFLRGPEAYKYGWGALDRPNRRRTLRRANR